jgi:hypothetical protein
MPETVASLIIENRHTGEILRLRRVRRGDEIWLEIKGTLPGGGDGPPMHIHLAQDEEGEVISGTIGFALDGIRKTAGAGQRAVFPRGSAHRWWNAGDDMLVFEGYAKPAVDLDRYLQAIFEVVNAGPEGRPPLFYVAHAMLRHRSTQAVLLMPLPVQDVLFRIVVAIGTVLGRYRGNEWPGCPARCRGAALATEDSQ